MTKNRLEAFSDGVIAILITIMVLELRPPHGTDLAALIHPTAAGEPSLVPRLLAYVLSYIYLGIYWNNHHHMLHACQRVTGGVLWANLHLLFWLSLVPFTTGWMGENHFAPHTVVLYGANLLLAAIAYYILQSLIVRAQGPDSLLRRALGGDWKGKVSPILYVTGIALAFVAPAVSLGIYAGVAAVWLIPDTRIERALEGDGAA